MDIGDFGKVSGKEELSDIEKVVFADQNVIEEKPQNEGSNSDAKVIDVLEMVKNARKRLDGDDVQSSVVESEVIG